MLCLAVGLLLMPVDRVMAQAVPAGSGDTNPADQPLPGQDLGSGLTLNQGVNAINAENESFDRFGLGLAASGGEITNFFGTQTNQQNATYAQFMADAGVILRTSRTTFFALYQPQYNVYPQFSEVNNYGQSMFVNFAHAMTERTAIGWNTTAARYLSLNQFLPQSLGIGGIGVVVPTLGVQLRENSFELTNAAASLSLRHLYSSQTTFTATLTGAYFLMAPSEVTGANPGISERLITGGADLRLEYQWTPRNTVGVEATPIYVYGISPSGHQAAETLQATYQRQLSATWTARVGAGPFWLQSSYPQFGSSQITSYAVSASLSRQVRQSQFAVGYNRALLVNFLEPATVANSFSSNARIPFGRKWILTGAGSYFHEAGSGSYGPGHFYGGSAQMGYQVTRKMQLFALYSVNAETFPTGVALQTYGFTQNWFGGGIRFNLGNATAPGGAQ